MRAILTYIVFIFSTVFLHAQKASQNPVPYAPDKKYTVEELHFDLAILKDAFVKMHPGLFWYQTEQEFEDNYTKLKKSINTPLTEVEFFTLVAPFVGNVKCSHTDMGLSEAFEKGSDGMSFFPFGVKIIDSKIFLRRNYANDTTIVLGSEIVKVNGIPVDSILRFIEPHGWADGFIKSHERIENNIQELFYSLFNGPDKYILNTVDPKGNPGFIEAEALNGKTIEKNALKRYSPPPNIGNEPFKLHIIDSLSTAILRIDIFMGKNYEKFLANTFSTLKDKGIKNLIIDLKGNPGGEDYNGRLLYSYIAIKEFKYYNRLEITLDNAPKDPIYKYVPRPLGKMAAKFFYTFKVKKTGNGKYDFKNWNQKNLSRKPFKPHKNNFTGNVFVLIDKGSSSASAEFSAVTHYNKRAKFIGRETGGGYCGNTSGGEIELTLPNTRLRTVIPLIKYYLAVEGPYGSGIKPDYELKEDIMDCLLDKNSDLLFALDLIKRSNNRP